MSRTPFNALTLIGQLIASRVSEGDICVDATAGRGHDTLALCRLVGPTGKVYAMDIQPEALGSTCALLDAEGMLGRAELRLMSHTDIDTLGLAGSVRCVTFNFGWLPGGDHDIYTKAETSVEAVKKSLDLLVPGGMITMIMYYGKNNGFEERDALLSFLPTIDDRRFTVVVSPFVNRKNCPPIPAVIFRDE